MRLLIISLCTQGIMRDHFIYYCREFSKKNELYCITNDNVQNDDLCAIQTLNISYHRKNPFGYFSFSKLRKIKEFIDEIRPDIIYILTHHATSLLLPPIIKKYKILYQVHDPVPHLGVGKLSSLIIKLQTKVYTKRADYLIVAGKAVKQQILEHFKVDKRKIVVIPFAMIGNLIHDEIAPSTEEIDLLFFGRIEPYKGMDVLVEALKTMKLKPITYIAGNGTICDKDGYEVQLPKNAVHLGYVKDDKLISYIKKAKVIVLPYHEASGTFTVCQAFYYGKPVIVSDVGTLPEYAADGGLVFKSGDSRELAKCIEKILENDDLRNHISINARKRYEESFTMEKISKMYQHIFEKTMENKK